MGAMGRAVPGRQAAPAARHVTAARSRPGHVTAAMCGHGAHVIRARTLPLSLPGRSTSPRGP